MSIPFATHDIIRENGCFARIKPAAKWYSHHSWEWAARFIGAVINERKGIGIELKARILQSSRLKTVKRPLTR